MPKPDLEIDMVRVAIEHHPAFEVVDMISDAYFEIVELATRPRLTDANIASIQRRRGLLQREHDFTISLLERNQWLAELAGVEGSLVEAYNYTLSQVDELTRIPSGQQR